MSIRIKKYKVFFYLYNLKEAPDWRNFSKTVHHEVGKNPKNQQKSSKLGLHHKNRIKKLVLDEFTDVYNLIECTPMGPYSSDVAPCGVSAFYGVTDNYIYLQANRCKIISLHCGFANLLFYPERGNKNIPIIIYNIVKMK